jgi:hypothetical protein
MNFPNFPACADDNIAADIIAPDHAEHFDFPFASYIHSIRKRAS